MLIGLWFVLFKCFKWFKCIYFCKFKEKNFIRNVFNDIIDKFDLDSYLDYVLWYNWFFVVD